MAALAPKPRDRVHFAVKFAAGAMRVVAVTVMLAGVGGAAVVLNLARIPGAQDVVMPDIVAVLLAAASVAVPLIGALILWGFADGLVLLADVDDAQRATQRQVADIILAQRTMRGPFHAETVAAAKVPDEVR